MGPSSSLPLLSTRASQGWLLDVGPGSLFFWGVPGLGKTLVWWACLSSAAGGVPHAARCQGEDPEGRFAGPPTLGEGSPSNLPLLSALGGHMAGLPNVAFIDLHSGSLREKDATESQRWEDQSRGEQMGGTVPSAASYARGQGDGVSQGGSQGGEGLGVSEKTGQLKESRQVGRKKSPKLYQSQSKDPWNVTSCLRLAEAQEERAQDLLEERPVGSHLPPSCLHFYLLPPTRVIMPRSPKRLCLTFEPGFQTLSDVQGLLIVQVPTAEEEEEEETASQLAMRVSGVVTDVCQLRQARGTNEEWKAVRSHKEGAIGGATPGTNHLRDSAAKGLGVNMH
ncbi:hypothetical protein J1605_002839 [Eschrichtius robustus]|uniref:Uncharacterized protein n=1 Tax=Eschrichtius robustus TaxID=9764 RepID=A0AB34HWQ3_ESCRO|nr:hypothetical protein J1605_002839 [Eschrichtius robustus]